MGIAPALTQGRDSYGNDIQPMVQVLPKFAIFHQFLQITVGGGDDPDIDLDSFLTADTLKLVVLEARRILPGDSAHVTYFVEKNGPPGALFEPSDARADGPREGSFFMAEKLALQQVFSGMAPQFTGMNGLSAAARCNMARATNSLPVPNCTPKSGHCCRYPPLCG